MNAPHARGLSLPFILVLCITLPAFNAYSAPAGSAPAGLAPEPVWALAVISNAGWSAFSGGAVDRAGNLYAAGSIKGEGTFDFGNGITLSGSAAYQQAVLVKYSAAGKALWARSVKGGESRFTSVAVGAAGAAYAAGSAAGLALVVQYGPEGNELWEYSADSSAQSSIYNAVTMDEAGAVYVAGSAERIIRIRSGYIEDSEPPRYRVEKDIALTEGIVAMYDGHGALKWSYGTFEHKDDPGEATDGELQPTVFHAIVADKRAPWSADGMVIVGGSMADSFAVCYLEKGRMAQGRGWFEEGPAGPPASRCASLANTPREILAAGSFAGAARLAFEERGPAVQGSAAVNPLIAGIDMVWPVWARSMVSGSGKAEFESVAFAGAHVAAGYITGATPYDFGNGARTSGSSRGKNAVIVQYNLDTQAQAARSVVSGNLESEFAALAPSAGPVDGKFAVYALGSMSGKGSLTFGTGVLAEGKSGKSTALIVKYALKAPAP